eukprot:CAMPEP_0172514062 /NCGR_PEP_ID=MMETSP1066-20121228/257371_1 /TAXON_ID=671091 /ORGANISM="Coscinodiscus wailesii, Strain CCMP2513" /LENGTH=231 /DNA_ID=CAMNT_0013294585 /DNA_START=101 /DNA_END=796 /DNA_ORIENTATION=+
MSTKSRILLAIVAVVISLSVLTTAETSDRYRECKRLCKDYFENTLDKAMCKPALDVAPRPGVFNACVNGRIFGFKAACLPTCLRDGDEAKRNADSFVACRREANKARPNNEFTWCRDGYDATFSEIQNVIGKLTAEWNFAGDDDSSERVGGIAQNSGSSSGELKGKLVSNNDSEEKATNDKGAYVPNKHRVREKEHSLLGAKRQQSKGVDDQSAAARDTVQRAREHMKKEF